VRMRGGCGVASAQSYAQGDQLSCTVVPQTKGRKGSYTSMVTMHSTPTNASLTASKPPFQILTCRSSQRCTPVEYVLYPIPPVMSSGSGGGWVRSIAKARSLADISSPWTREMWRLGMSSVVLYVGDSGAAAGEVEEGEGAGERAGKMEDGGAGSQGAGWQRTVRSSPSPHPASRT
jgi:hypothetical protein